MATVRMCETMLANSMLYYRHPAALRHVAYEDSWLADDVES